MKLEMIHEITVNALKFIISRFIGRALDIYIDWLFGRIKRWFIGWRRKRQKI